MKTYTMCGSMRFEEEMRKVAYDLETQKGYNFMLQLIRNQQQRNCRHWNLHITEK